MSRLANCFPIVGGRKIEHLHDNIQALSLKLTAEQIKYLESVRPFEPGFPNNFLGEDPFVTGKSGRLERTSRLAFPHLPPMKEQNFGGTNFSGCFEATAPHIWRLFALERKARNLLLDISIFNFEYQVYRR